MKELAREKRYPQKRNWTISSQTNSGNFLFTAERKVGLCSAENFPSGVFGVFQAIGIVANIGEVRIEPRKSWYAPGLLESRDSRTSSDQKLVE